MIVHTSRSTSSASIRSTECVVIESMFLWLQPGQALFVLLPFLVTTTTTNKNHTTNKTTTSANTKHHHSFLIGCLLSITSSKHKQCIYVPRRKYHPIHLEIQTLNEDIGSIWYKLRDVLGAEGRFSATMCHKKKATGAFGSTNKTIRPMHIAEILVWHNMIHYRERKVFERKKIIARLLVFYLLYNFLDSDNQLMTRGADTGTLCNPLGRMGRVAYISMTIKNILRIY